MIARNSVGGLISGGIILADAACPSGYSRVTVVDGKFVVGGAAYNAAAGGGATHTHNVPAHTHPQSSGTTGGGTASGSGTPTTRGDKAHTHPGGSGTSGTGGAATSDSKSNSPPFANVLLCKKD